MSFRPPTSRFLVALLLAAAQDGRPQNPVAVILIATTSPSAGEPGVTNISVTGSNFPSGTIAASNVTISLKPAAGGSTVTTHATTVATVVGTTRRVSFTIPAPVSVATPTAYTVSLAGATSSNVAFASSNTASLTIDPAATLTNVTPNSGQTGQSLTVSVTGSFSNFVQNATLASFGAGITINSTTITNATHASVSLTIASNASPGPRTVTMTTGVEVALLANGFTVSTTAPTISDFNPKSAPVGTLITMTGMNLQPNAGTVAQFALAKQGGGTLTGFASTASATSITFIIPSGAATGVVSITVNGANANTATPLMIVPSSGFTLTATPPSASLIQGQSVAYSLQLSSANGFNRLAQLSVTGVPSGVTASFSPASITAGQTSILTLSAPSGQATGTTALSLSAAATVGGLPVTQSAPVALSVVAPTTTLLGRTVVSNSLQTPLAGVTIKTLGLDGNGNTTGCTSDSTTSDAAGNFALTDLPLQCTGPQLISFDGTTATAPPGKYAGVNLVFTLNPGQVTASPVLVHLPRIDNVETFLVTQNASTNQTYGFTSIPGLSVTVYAGTSFTLADGTQPNPFPLAAVQVPVDRLPDAKPNVPTMIRCFIVAFQPANTTSNEPVAVFFPNTLNTPPGTDMALMTLDPTHGQMVPYGTGAVSADGTQIVPDSDPAHPGHLFGLVHFDWHGPMPPPPPQGNPAPPGSGGSGGGPGAGPGGGPGGSSGPGAGDGGDNGGDDDGTGNGGDTGDGGVNNNPPDSGTCAQSASTQPSFFLTAPNSKASSAWLTALNTGTEGPYTDGTRSRSRRPGRLILRYPNAQPSRHCYQWISGYDCLGQDVPFDDDAERTLFWHRHKPQFQLRPLIPLSPR